MAETLFEEVYYKCKGELDAERPPIPSTSTLSRSSSTDGIGSLFSGLDLGFEDDSDSNLQELEDARREMQRYLEEFEGGKGTIHEPLIWWKVEEYFLIVPYTLFTLYNSLIGKCVPFPSHFPHRP
jgi:hypothetical protein